MTLWVRDQVLVSDVIVARTFWSRLMGLMGHATFDGKGYLFPHTNSIHTLFMKMPIAVVYLSRTGRVLKVTPELKPWRIGPFVPGAWWTLELPPGWPLPLDGDEVTGLPKPLR